MSALLALLRQSPSPPARLIENSSSPPKARLGPGLGAACLAWLPCPPSSPTCAMRQRTAILLSWCLGAGSASAAARQPWTSPRETDMAELQLRMGPSPSPTPPPQLRGHRLARMDLMPRLGGYTLGPGTCGVVQSNGCESGAPSMYQVWANAECPKTLLPPASMARRLVPPLAATLDAVGAMRRRAPGSIPSASTTSLLRPASVAFLTSITPFAGEFPFLYMAWRLEPLLTLWQRLSSSSMLLLYHDQV